MSVKHKAVPGTWQVLLILVPFFDFLPFLCHTLWPKAVLILTGGRKSRLVKTKLMRKGRMVTAVILFKDMTQTQSTFYVKS